MTIDIEDIVRRMVLLGIPLLPLGCGTSCPDTPGTPTERLVDIARPTNVDGGYSRVTAAAFESCLEGGDCLALCKEYFGGRTVVQSCTRVGSDGSASDPKVTVHAVATFLCTGRRPERGRPSAVHARCELGAWLAQAAHAEALSVPAFDRLARELTAHGAPPALARAARQSAREERRHTRMMTSLARRHDTAPAAVGAAPPDHVRTLEAMATENAAEGCVRETLGALIARWQSTWAADASIRAAMTVIARDEARHAELAWRVDAWATTRLGPAARGRVRGAKLAAVRKLEREVRKTDVGRALARQAGIPDAATTLAIARTATPLLWQS